MMTNYLPKCVRSLRRCIVMAALCFVASLPAVAGKHVLRPIPDSTTVLHNPLNGWVIYLNRNWDADFWQHEGYEHIPTGPLGRDTVSITQYGSVCYFRTGWSSFEPHEGLYAWLDDNSRIMRLLRSAVDHGCKIAFRIVVDGRDQGQNTPLYVREAGAKGFVDSRGVWTPYVDDTVFQAKYEKFVRALGRRFNDPDIMSFIDGYGFGKWGEGHAVAYADYRRKESVFKWNINLYATAFSRVPCVINYHRLIGDTVSWGKPAPESERLLDYAVERGFSLRHDAFGMTDYYQDWERHYAEKWRYRRPIIMEGGWITGAHHRYWIDGSGRYREGYAEDVRQGEYDDSREAHVNMMDFRVGDQIRSWFSKAFPLVRRFVAEGGYRLYPSSVTYDDRVGREGLLTVDHTWTNMGWGYCPTNIPQWAQKYKVAFALINRRGEVARVIVDQQTDLSTWHHGFPTHYTARLNVLGLGKGSYTLALALVDVSRQNREGIRMAVSPKQLHAGWLVLGKVRIR